ncbi:hypothetical protein H4582DRAFT_1925055 [Lactarius indigo]|nr:hypothetical protein H4582DRAFT_1925055 [Lactarius indigo]
MEFLWVTTVSSKGRRYFYRSRGNVLLDRGLSTPLTSKQHVTARTDWLTTDTEVARPDLNCASELRIHIVHMGLQQFRHGGMTCYQYLLPKEADDYDVAWVWLWRRQHRKLTLVPSQWQTPSDLREHRRRQMGKRSDAHYSTLRFDRN